jgi:hypothetical protein
MVPVQHYVIFLFATNQRILSFRSKSYRSVKVAAERIISVFVYLFYRNEAENEPRINVLNAINFAFEIECQIDDRKVVLNGEGY